MSDHQMLDLVSLYALDALEGTEKSDFEEHVRDCPECRSALDDNRTVAAKLVPDEPASEETWQRISQAISSDADVVKLPRMAAVWKWVATAAAVAAVVSVGVLLADLTQGDQFTSDRIVAAAQDAAEEPGAFVGDFLVEDTAVATVVLTSDGRGFVIPTEDLSPIEEARAYQLWVINDTEDVISAGVLGNDPDPATFTWTGDVTGFALTREVAGGVVSSEGDVVSVITGL